MNRLGLSGGRKSAMTTKRGGAERPRAAKLATQKHGGGAMPLAKAKRGKVGAKSATLGECTVMNRTKRAGTTPARKSMGGRTRKTGGNSARPAGMR